MTDTVQPVIVEEISDRPLAPVTDLIGAALFGLGIGFAVAAILSARGRPPCNCHETHALDDVDEKVEAAPVAEARRPIINEAALAELVDDDDKTPVGPEPGAVGPVIAPAAGGLRLPEPDAHSKVNGARKVKAEPAEAPSGRGK